MNDIPLGRLEPVPLRDIWTSEAQDFTPWLAQEANLKLLGKTLELDLELESVENEIGSFRADIVCTESDTGSMVLIENQLEQTNHAHLGQLLTYAAGLQALTVVWVAERFRHEHRAAIDWLNDITHDKFRFFALEIQLWRIEDSLAAPKFNIVSMPNDWSRSVAPGLVASEKKLKQMRYWSGLQEVLNASGGPVAGNRQPRPQHWSDYPIGKTGFKLSASMNTGDECVRVQLYISGDDANERLALLEEQKGEIEKELDYPLVWGDQREAAQDRRISYYFHNIDLDDESDWPRQHKWLSEHLNGLHRAFAHRIRNL